METNDIIIGQTYHDYHGKAWIPLEVVYGPKRVDGTHSANTFLCKDENGTQRRFHESCLNIPFPKDLEGWSAKQVLECLPIMRRATVDKLCKQVDVLLN